ncbi:MAG: molybdopterin-binding protein [Acetobacteraceae bacterium]|nr:MAG: molybdopterin-binding protein [Acetobacteraceae bacterium]
MSAPPRLVPVAEALRLLLGLLPPVAPRRLPLAQAIGRVLAAPLRARGPVPPVAIALREGWAVAAALTEGAGPYAPVLLPGLAWIAAGAALPPGTDAVLQPFARDGDLVLEPVGPGEGVRLAGETAQAGIELRPAGTLLRPADLLLADAGIEAASVRVPRIALPGASALAALAAAEGAEVAEADPDLVLACGLTLDTVHCPALGARPGEATAIGTLGGRPAVRLGPLPEDLLAGWWLLGRPALRALAGRTAPPPRRLTLGRKVASPIGFTGVVPLGPGGMPQDSALAPVEALLIVPPGLEGYDAGTQIEACDP